MIKAQTNAFFNNFSKTGSVFVSKHCKDAIPSVPSDPSFSPCVVLPYRDENLDMAK